MAKNKFVIAVADDWEALYLNGVAIQQDHEIRREYLLAFMIEHKVRAEDVEEIEAYNDPELESGQFPDKLEDVTRD